jgi:hypothetical protein
MLEKGKYLGNLVGFQSTHSKSGAAQVVLVFNVFAIQQVGDFNSIDAIERTVYISLHENSWTYSQKKLQGLQFNGDFGAGMGFGRTENITLECEHNEYDGKTREKWNLADWGTQERAELPKPPGKTIQELNAKWRIKAGAVTPAVVPVRQPSAQVPAAAKPAEAPKRSGPPPVKAATATREEAWASCAAGWAGMSDDAQAQQWQQLLASIFGANYDESILTSADWGNVKAKAPKPPEDLSIKEENIPF